MKDDLITRKVKLFHVVFVDDDGKSHDITLPSRYKLYNDEKLKNSINRNKDIGFHCHTIASTYETEDYYYLELQEFLKVAKKGKMMHYKHQTRIVPL